MDNFLKEAFLDLSAGPPHEKFYVNQQIGEEIRPANPRRRRTGQHAPTRLATPAPGRRARSWSGSGWAYLSNFDMSSSVPMIRNT